MWSLIEAPIPNAPEGKYISQIPTPNNLLSISSALKSKGEKDIKVYNFIKERDPKIIKADNIVYNMGEATCMDYLYNYAIKYLDKLRVLNPSANIWLTGYHIWLHNKEDRFKSFKHTTPHEFENDIIKDYSEKDWPNDWTVNDWEFMDKNVKFKGRGIRVTLRASRGCPFGCVMCPVKYTYEQKVKRHPVEWVINEIDTLYNKYNIREIGFLDDNMFCDKKWGKELLKNIIESNFKGLKFTFEEGLDVPTAVDEELVSMLKQAGFYHVKLGVEALNKTSLDYIKKPYRDPDMAIKAIKLLQKYKLSPICFLCIGFPHDTEKSIKKDLDVMIDMKVKLRVQILWPYPGVEFAGKCVVSNEKLKKLACDAMYDTGSVAWKRKK